MYNLLLKSVELSSPAPYNAIQNGITAEGLFELRPLLYRCELSFPSVLGLFISLLLSNSFYICQK